MGNKLPIAWMTQDNDLVGNAFGYRTHNKNMMKFGSAYFTQDFRADVALHIVPADKFQPVEGKFNILFTMWEFLDLPQSYIHALPKADMIVVPCSFCRDLFARYTDKPIYVCWEGVDVKKFTYKERKYDGREPFRFLWVGAPNPRKGYPLVLEATKLFEQIENVEIYLKTTTPKFDRKSSLERTWKNRKVLRECKPDFVKNLLLRCREERKNGELHNIFKRTGAKNNVIYDARILSDEELIALYHSAHCFILPSFGEGWGLTLSEAMATGAPCVSVDYTGCKDFFSDSVGYTIDYYYAEQELANYDLTTRSHVPDTKDFIQQMLCVLSNYKEAVKRGNKASELIRKKFTWEQSAKRLHEIVKIAYEQVTRKVA